MASAAELSGDRFMSALSAYLASRHDVALRLLSEVDKEEAASEKAEEEALRDEALSALVQRNYEAAHEATAQLSAVSARRRRVAELRHKMRIECDRVNSAREVLEQRAKILQQTPPFIQDPLLGGIGESLHRRHEVAMRLVAAIDAQLVATDVESADAIALQRRRARLMLEIDVLLAATQAHEQKEALLDTASGVLGHGAPDSGAYLRRTLAFLDARSTVILRIIAFIDEQLGACPTSPSDVVTEARQVHAQTAREHLAARRADLVRELDEINAQVTQQRQGEAMLKAWGLHAVDPYAAKIRQYLEGRSETSLQLLAFIDARCAAVDTDELRSLAAQREAVQQQVHDSQAPLMTSVMTSDDL